MNDRLLAKVSFDGWHVPIGFVSDGCSVPSILQPLAYAFLDLYKARPACLLHDFLSQHMRYYGMSFVTADAIFRRHLKSLGLSAWQATVYWLAVKLARPFRQFIRPKPMPLQWVDLNRRNMQRYGLKIDK